MAQADQQAPTPQPIGVLGIQGRNGSDSSFTIQDGQCLEARNVDWFRSSLGRKRGGSDNLDLTSLGAGITNGVLSMGRFIPGFDQTESELWVLDGSRQFHRLAGGVLFADPATITDPCLNLPQEANYLSFNGKLFISYGSGLNRLHCYDPSTATLRRVGLVKGDSTILAFAPAGGTITDTRKYRYRLTVQDAGVTIRKGELSGASAAQALVAQQVTVSGAGGTTDEGATHVEVYGASTPTFSDYRLVGTSVYTAGAFSVIDNAALDGEASDDEGLHTTPPSAKFMVADDTRIIMAGAHEDTIDAAGGTAPSPRAVWWTSRLEAGEGSDERIALTGPVGGVNNYTVLEEAVTGLSQPMQAVSAGATSLERGSFYAFSFDNQWKFIATGQPTNPYTIFKITGGGGCVHHKSILTAIDANGNPAIYWWSKDGPFRICVDGQQFLGEDIIDILELVNLDATIPCHSVYYSALSQVWFYVATEGSEYPNLKVVFDTRFGRVVDVLGVRFGWSVHDGASAEAYCSLMFSSTIGAQMGRDLQPYIGGTRFTSIWKCDTDSEMDGDNSTFKAYIDTKSYAPWGLGRKGGISDNPFVVADPARGTTIRLSIYRNEGAEVHHCNADLTDHSENASAEKVFPMFEDARLQDSFSFRCRIGDEQPTASSWNLHALVVPVDYQGAH